VGYALDETDGGGVEQEGRIGVMGSHGGIYVSRLGPLVVDLTAHHPDTHRRNSSVC
jgi:hypothetical protein